VQRTGVRTRYGKRQTANGKRHNTALTTNLCSPVQHCSSRAFHSWQFHTRTDDEITQSKNEQIHTVVNANRRIRIHRDKPFTLRSIKSCPILAPNPGTPQIGSGSFKFVLAKVEVDCNNENDAPIRRFADGRPMRLIRVPSLPYCNLATQQPASSRTSHWPFGFVLNRSANRNYSTTTTPCRTLFPLLLASHRPRTRTTRTTL
jgi:hypothetical protein